MTATMLTFFQQVVVNMSLIEHDAQTVVARENDNMLIASNTADSSFSKVRVPSFAYQDVAGNLGQEELVIWFTPRVEKPVAIVSKGVAIIAPAILSASLASTTLASIMAAGSALASQSLAGQSNMLRAGYHIQILAMSANIAVPQVSGKHQSIVTSQRQSNMFV